MSISLNKATNDMYFPRSKETELLTTVWILNFLHMWEVRTATIIPGDFFQVFHKS